MPALHSCNSEQSSIVSYNKGLNTIHNNQPNNYSVQYMEKKPSLKCQNQHDAQMICIRPECAHSPPICDNRNCVHSSSYQKCMMKIKIDEVLSMLVEKRMQYSSIDEKIIQCYNQIIKLVEVEKQEYLNVMKLPRYRLKGDEALLFRFLNGELVKEVKPIIIHNAIQGLAESRTEEMQKLRSKTINLGDRVLQEVKKIIVHFRKIWGDRQNDEGKTIEKVVSNNDKPQSTVIYRFSKELCNSSIEVLPLGKEIKRKEQYNGFGSFALVSPPISGSNRIRIKIVKNGSNILVGLAHRLQMIENGFKLPKNDQGVCAIRGDGYVINVSDSEKHRKQSSFKFASNDIVEMWYDPSSQVLIIENKSKRIAHILKNVRNEQGNDLHFCVQMILKDQQVKILEGNQME